MKNQYFGDTRDLFKYDLILDLLQNSGLSHFVLIPMLTENEPSTHGSRINYGKANAGVHRVELRSFLEKCVFENRRNIKELENFFRKWKPSKSVKLAIYRVDDYFSNEKREEYFSSINIDALARSVILADPDIGIEVRSMRGKEEKYIRYTEIRLLYDRMGSQSILLIFQYIPRTSRKQYLSRICNELEKRITSGFPIHFVTDSQIVFFILTKDSNLQRVLKTTLPAYASSYGLDVGTSD